VLWRVLMAPCWARSGCECFEAAALAQHAASAMSARDTMLTAREVVEKETYGTTHGEEEQLLLTCHTRTLCTVVDLDSFRLTT